MSDTYELTGVCVFDQEEIHRNCTVQILSNSITGDTSVGWWENYWLDLEDGDLQDNVDVLVKCKDGCRHVAYRTEGYAWEPEKKQWFVRGPMGSPRRLTKTVAGWMPLPE